MSSRFGFMSLVLLALMPPVAEAQVKLEHKFREGSTSTIKTKVKTRQLLTVAGMELATNVVQVVGLRSEIGTRNSDRTLPIQHTIVALSAEMELPGGVSITFDSSNPDAKIEPGPYAFLGDAFRATVGLRYTVVLDAENRVKFIEGTEANTARIDALDEKAAALVRSQITADQLKRKFEQAHGRLPTVLARPGDSWEVTEVDDIGGDQTLTFRKRFGYRGTVTRNGQSLDEIGEKAISVSYAMEPNSKPLKVTGSDLKIDSSEGTILFDRAAGEVVESKSLTRIKGAMTFAANGQDYPSTLDLTLDITSSREAERASKK